MRTVPLTREWTRIGRSLAADVRFDDPTVSRRHALIVRQADGVRVLDDRSLNGVFVNGERDRVERAPGRRRDPRRPLPAVLPQRRRASPAQSSGLGRTPRCSSAGLTASRRAGRVVSRLRMRVVSRPMPRHDRRALPEGRHRQDDHGAHARRRAAAGAASARWRSTSTRRATCPTTSTCRPTPSRRSATSCRRERAADEAIHDDLIPANLSLAEAELMLGGKMGRELTLRRALATVRRRLRGDADRLPALARTADGQRARRRRLRAHHRRGPVLRAAGGRAGDRGDRPRAREPQPGRSRCSACC